MPRGYSERQERLARTVLFAAMAVSAITILVLARNFTFWSDELDWLTFQDDFGLGGLLEPHGSHLMLTNRIIYEGLPRLFGTSYMPFRLIEMACLFTCAGMLFVLVRRRMGGPVALAPAAVLLFFGSAQDIVLSPLGIPFALSIAFGLGALAAVELGHPRGDWLAFVLIALSIVSHTFGTIIAFGIAIYLILEPRTRRRLWVAAVPLVLWFIWWCWARQFHQGIVTSSDLLFAPFRLIDAAGAALEGAVGIPPEFGHKSPVLEAIFSVIFDLIAFVGMVALAFRLSNGKRESWLWSYTAIVVIFWAGIALADPVERATETPRYLFFGAIMIVLIVAEAFRGTRIPKRAVPWLLVIFAVSLIGNVAQLAYSVPGFVHEAQGVRAVETVVGLAGDGVDPERRPWQFGLPANRAVPSSVGQLNEFTSDIGPLGFTLDQLRVQPDKARLQADFILAHLLGVTAVPISKADTPKTTGCVTYKPGDDGYTTFPLNFGGNLIRLIGDPGDPGAGISLGRFADQASVPIGTISATTDAGVLLPEDAAPDTWFATSAGRVRVCGVAG
jgi:hypothetical protein